ncbi:MAG TPA: DUF885 family protein [Thermoanaerobaculia bacterium]|jgi:uncharacterized protein (DUF885 family)|nr:DUF885 family protein [Thermoanaerobaculia bacterium]
MFKRLIPAAALCFLASAAFASPADLAERRKALDALLAEQWEYNLKVNPEFASILGDKRYNDRLSDNTPEAIAENYRQTAEWKKRFEAIDTTGFPEQEALNKTLMVRDLAEALADQKFKSWEMPVTQFYGIHIQAPSFVQYLSFETVKDYEDYITRLGQFPRAFDETIALMRQGMADRLMPPKLLLEKVAVQAEGIAKQAAEETPFAHPFAKFPETIPAADQARLREKGLAAVRTSVLPAYAKFTAFVRDEYAPKGRSEPGVWALPDGAARYAALVKSSTTTDMTPEEIHQLGLSEVTRIEGEMQKIAVRLGFKDWKALSVAIEANPELHAKSGQQIVDLYSKYIAQMNEKLPQLFGLLPKSKCIVKPIEAFREKDSSSAEYNQGTPDGSRPGIVMVNTYDFAKRKTINIETTAYHEGVPGHHMQISIAQELPTLPPFRQQGGNTAYVEGWALYSEDLGAEVGFFQDPYNLYGHYMDEMLRAIRLVVDTGFHYKHWTRDQVVQFFHDHSGIDEIEVQSETDRYIAVPSQALGYKIGQLKIRELRERAKHELGPKFDLKSFHDEVLGAGALPLDVLSARIDSWIAGVKAGTAK